MSNSDLNPYEGANSGSYSGQDPEQNPVSSTMGSSDAAAASGAPSSSRPQLRENSIDKAKFNNVYVNNLSESVTDGDLKRIFDEFGTTTRAVVMKNAYGKSKCFGFVHFEESDAAANAVEALNGKKFDDKEWYVGRAQYKAEREAELKLWYAQRRNLYIGNLPWDINDKKLEELFSLCGSVASCKVIRNPDGSSKGYGFLAFATAEEASLAVNVMNGEKIFSRRLHVAIAERKEDRIARLLMAAPLMPQAVVPRMPMYPPGVPGIGQQHYYDPGSPFFIPQQPVFGYQHPSVPGLRPVGFPAPRFSLPMLQQGQPGFGYQQGHVQQSTQMMQQPVPPISGAFNPLSSGFLASLVDADGRPERQRQLLGEKLHPRVEQLVPEMAAEVTEMLLQMDQNEVLNLLETPDDLKEKIDQVMEEIMGRRSAEIDQQPC